MDRFGGYLVNANSGLVLAAFKEPAHALRWALSTIHLCLEADWDPELLTHELAEEVVVCNNATDVDASRDVSDGGRRNTFEDIKFGSGKHLPEESSVRGSFQIGVGRHSAATTITTVTPGHPEDMTGGPTASLDNRPSPGVQHTPFVSERASLPVVLECITQQHGSHVRQSDMASASEPFMYNQHGDYLGNMEMMTVPAGDPGPRVEHEQDRRSTASRSVRPVQRNTLIFRGLRLKVGA
jgi:hypothetical protein